MPFKSSSQLRKFGALTNRGDITKRKFKQWRDETPSISGLPERASAASRIKNRLVGTGAELKKRVAGIKEQAGVRRGQMQERVAGLKSRGLERREKMKKRIGGMKTAAKRMFKRF